MIAADIIGQSNLNNSYIERQQTVDVRIRVIHTGLSGAEVRFVAKLSEYLDDDNDSRAIINKHSGDGGGINIDSNSSDNILVARMRINAADTNLIPPNTTLDWGIQVKNSSNEVILPELKGKLFIKGDIVKS